MLLRFPQNAGVFSARGKEIDCASNWWLCCSEGQRHLRAFAVPQQWFWFLMSQISMPVYSPCCLFYVFKTQMFIPPSLVCKMTPGLWESMELSLLLSSTMTRNELPQAIVCPQLHLGKTLCSSWELFVQYLPGYGEQLCSLILECILSAPLTEYAADKADHIEGAISRQALSQNPSHRVPDVSLLFILPAYCTISGKLCIQLWALLSSLALDKFLYISKCRFCLWYQEINFPHFLTSTWHPA